MFARNCPIFNQKFSELMEHIEIYFNYFDNWLSQGGQITDRQADRHILSQNMPTVKVSVGLKRRYTYRPIRSRMQYIFSGNVHPGIVSGPISVLERSSCDATNTSFSSHLSTGNVTNLGVGSKI